MAMYRWSCLGIASMQAIALAVILNRFGFLVFGGSGNVVKELSNAIYKGANFLGMDPSTCGFVDDEDVVIVSSRVVTPQGVIAAAVYIQEGKIAKIVPSAAADLNASATVINYGDAVISPGIVDTHVHLNEPGREDWEGMKSGTKAAAAGGITTVIDMPLNSHPTTSIPAVRMKILIYKAKSYVNFGIWGGLVPENAAMPKVLAGMIENGALGLKVFLSPSGLDDFPQSLKSHVSSAVPILMNLSVPLYIHAEIPTPVEVVGNKTIYTTYLDSRPPQFEKDAVQMLIDILEEQNSLDFKPGFRVHIAHLSDAGSLEKIKSARLNGLPLSVETCPHYLAFAAEDISSGATQYKCAPPIRSKANQAQLWDAVLNGDIDMITSDHSPAPSSLKTGMDFLAAWGGISGLQYTLPALWNGAEQRNMSLRRAAEILSEEPAKLANLHASKGFIREGYDADLMVWDPEQRADTSEAGCHHKHRLSPYRDLNLKGRVLATWVHGKLIFTSQRGVARKPCGKVIGMGSWSKNWD